MTITTDSSHPEVARTTITPPSGTREPAIATITTQVADRHNSSVMGFMVEGEQAPDPTRAALAQGAPVSSAPDYNGKEVRRIAFDAEQSPAVLARLGLPASMQASVDMHYNAANQSAGITITSLQTGADAVVFTPDHARAMVKALASEKTTNAQGMESSLLPDSLRMEVLKAHPELVVTAQREQGVTIDAAAVHTPHGNASLTFGYNKNTRTEYIGIVAEQAQAGHAIRQHLDVQGIKAELRNDQLTLPKGVSGEQAMAALAKPASGIVIEDGQPLRMHQAAIIPTEIAAHAAPMVEELRPSSPVFGAVSRITGGASRAMQQAMEQARNALPTTPVQVADAQEPERASLPKTAQTSRGNSLV